MKTCVYTWPRSFSAQNKKRQKLKLYDLVGPYFHKLVKKCVKSTQLILPELFSNSVFQITNNGQSGRQRKLVLI